MSGRQKLILILLVAMMFSLFSISCRQSTTPTGEAPKVEQPSAPAVEAPKVEKPYVPTQVIVSNDRDIVNVDPAFISAPADYGVANLVYSSLVRLKSGTFDQVIPDLAETWEVSPDGLTYTFHLRKGVQWHHGHGELTSADVLAHFLRIKDRESGSRYVADMIGVDVEALDDYTVRFNMERPYPGFMTAVLAYRPGFILNKQIVEDKPDSLSTDPVGTGPYVFSEWQPGVELKLTANPDYYGGKPAVDTVIFKIIQDDNVAEMAMERGEIDARYFQTSEVQKRVAAGGKLTLITGAMPRTYYFGLNTEKPPFDDVRVRQALRYSLDRDSIVETVFLGSATVADTMVNPLVSGHLSDRVYRYDPDKAVQLLKDAGISPGTEFTIMTLGLQEYQDMSTIAMANWEKVGLNVKVQIVETAELLERCRSGAFDLWLFAQLRTEPEQILIPFFYSGSIPASNWSRYAEIDDLIDGFRYGTDSRQRVQFIQDAQRRLQQDSPHIPIANPVMMLALNPRIKNAELGLLIYNVWEWEVEGP